MKQKNRPRKAKQTSPSTVKEQAFGGRYHSQTASTEALKSILSYHDMPLEVFIKRVNDGTIDADIYERFFDEIKNREQQYIDSLITEINLNETKYNIVKLSIKLFECLEIREQDWRKEKEVLAILKKYLYIGPSDKLKVILTRAKGFIVDADNKKKELELLLPKGEGNRKADEDYFDHLIIQITKHMAFYVDKRIVTVSIFAGMIRDLRDTIDKHEQDKLKREINGGAGARPSR